MRKHQRPPGTVILLAVVLFVAGAVKAGDRDSTRAAARIPATLAPTNPKSRLEPLLKEAIAGVWKAGNMQIIWHVDQLGEIGGLRPTVLGHPQVIQALGAAALYFDGRKDGLILNTNPLSGARSFTIEVIFRPDPSPNKAQRFLHMQASEESRVLVETRLNDANEWFLDTFIKSGESEKTLQSLETVHPLGSWYHAALTYDGRWMRHYVNGTEEMSGEVRYAPVETGQSSIGCRLNQVFWFQGAIQKIRITHEALSPSQFLDRPE